ncbi:arginine exporter protein ArgO [mine drainage metagenome]|uniref:Arginine exporter protein ArgO n=1 Tax=mine drainage metagenome TaxID=410659 RepID=A0A1J5QYD8_9ZZZZ
MSVAIQGFLTGLSLIVAIGAQNAFVLRQGIRREHVLTVVVVCAVADAVLVTAGVGGLGAAITTHPVAVAVARVGGAAFLAAFAVLALRRARRPGSLVPADDAPATHLGVLVACLGFTFLNPHVYLDTVVLLGSLASQHGDPGRWVFGAGAVAASVTWFVGLGFGARRLRPFFARPRSWQVLDYGVAAVMTTLAVALVA